MSEDGRRPGVDLREVTRATVRDHVAEHALRLFDERGFDATTIDDIANSVGMSSRTFFRYFPTKEDVVLQAPASFGPAVREAAASRPRSECVWKVLRHAFDPIEANAVQDPMYGLRTMRVVMSTESLRAGNLEKHLAWAAMLEPTILDRLDDEGESGRFRARSLIHAAMACLDVALEEWTRRDGAESLGGLLDQAFAMVRE